MLLPSGLGHWCKKRPPLRFSVKFLMQKKVVLGSHLNLIIFYQYFRKKVIYLKINKNLCLSDKATQFRGDKSDIVRPIYKLAVIIQKSEHKN